MTDSDETNKKPMGISSAGISAADVYSYQDDCEREMKAEIEYLKDQSEAREEYWTQDNRTQMKLIAFLREQNAKLEARHNSQCSRLVIECDSLQSQITQYRDMCKKLAEAIRAGDSGFAQDEALERLAEVLK